MNDLVRACMVRRQADAFVRGALYRELKRGPVKLSHLTRRVLTRYPEDFNEASASKLVAEVARDYTARTRLGRGR